MGVRSIAAPRARSRARPLRQGWQRNRQLGATHSRPMPERLGRTTTRKGQVLLMGEPATAKSPGFSARIELEELEPLVSLVRRLNCHAALRVHTEEGGVGLLLYAGGELAAGSFDGASGPLALERLLALRSGAVELEVLPREPASFEPALPAVLERIPRHPAPPVPAPSPTPAQPTRRVEATSALVEPPAPRSWRWALAPGLALALWLAAELAQHLSQK